MKSTSNIFTIITILSILLFSQCDKKDSDPEPNPNPDNQSPTASIAVNPETGTINTIFGFDATASTDPETPEENLVVRWDWEGDGTWDTDYSNNKTADHQYTVAGSYNAKVEVKDESGSTATADKQITVEDACPTKLVDPRDGKEYATIEIGEQCWMAENINIGSMIDGTGNPANNSNIEKYCYDDSEANCDHYGGLYQWNEMMQYSEEEGAQGICPDGWHIPTDTEWMMLEVEVGMSVAEATETGYRGTDEGAKLRQGGSSGFEALMGGYRNSGGSFNSLSFYGTFFTSTSASQQNLGWVRYLFSAEDQILRNKYDKTMGLSVRCLKN